VAHDANLALDIKSIGDLALTAPPSTTDAERMTSDELKDSRLATYLNVLKAVVTAQNMLHVPVQISCWSDIPPNAGLSSSSALLVAALHATDAWLGREYGLHELSERAREIEFRKMGITCGFQDFYATTFGGLTYLDFRGKARWRGPKVDPFATVEPLLSPSHSVPLVLAHTGQQRDSGETHRPLRERWVDGDPCVREVMRKLGSIARQSKRHVLENDWSSVGKYMNQAHKQIVSVGGSGVVNDTLISRAIAFGARGAKLAGAGKGGTIIALHDEPVALVDDLLDGCSKSTRLIRVFG
jgi:galactokinase/mevalonate kinase-like predicted kinase